MTHRRPATLALCALILAVAGSGLALAACSDTAPTRPQASLDHAAHAGRGAAAGAPLTAETEQQLAQLRALTAPFHRIEAASAAGWSMPIPGCFSDPAGGMGYHFGNQGLIDGDVDALEPELLVYEPQANGRMRLVAVEYIVPFGMWTASAPPSLYGQSFHRNEGFGLWVLHVWHFRHNPSGIFADWNPTVTCEHASD